MLKKEEVSKDFELLLKQRKSLYQSAVGECPNCQESVEAQKQELKSQIMISGSSLERFYLNNINSFLEYNLHNKAFVTIGNTIVDTVTSDNYYICKCTKCGKTWKVSKNQLDEEAKRIDKQIAKINGDKKYGFGAWLKARRYHICLFLSLSMYFMSLIMLCIKYFG